MSSNAIQVSIKLRPCEPGHSSLWQVKEGRSIQLADTDAEPSVFDYVFDEGASNQEVFERMAQHIVQSCMQGFNGTIFAYGQTSSGKTYTMMGDGQNPGVMVLAAKEIFQQIANDTERDFLLRVGYIEIYNEKIYDLLNKKNQDLKIHEAGNGIVNVNCEECIITSEDDLLRLLSLGNKERTVGETDMNERSSRSHAIFRIIIESRKSDLNDDDAVIQSVLNLVDLAGSERADQTGATGARLKEGAHIKKSLMFLSNVIKNLSENEDDKFINFRDSKLTRILQPTLSGNGFTSIICTIKPWVMEESQSTLSFATVAKKIRLKPHANSIVYDLRMKKLDTEIKDLQNQVAAEKRTGNNRIILFPLEGRIQSILNQFVSGPSMEVNFNEIQEHYDSLSNQLLESMHDNDSLREELEQPAKLSELQDTNTELKAEIEKLVKASAEKQQLFDAQSQKLSDDALLIEQLQERNAKLAESLSQMEARAEQTIEELRETLMANEKQKTDEINALQLKYMTESRAKFRCYTLELEESKATVDTLKEHHEQLAIYTDNLREEKSLLQIKIEEADARHSCTLKKLHELERELEDMNQQKSELHEELETITDKMNDVQESLESAKRKAYSYDNRISEHVKVKSSSSNLQEKVASQQSKLVASGKEVSSRDLEINELGSDLRHALEAKDAVENQAKNVQHQAELVESLKEKLAASEAKAAQHQAELEAIKEKLAEEKAKQDYIDGITSQTAAREAALAEQESALDSLKMENQKLLEQMKVLLSTSNDKIQDLQAKCDQQAVALDNLKQEKISLQSDINEAHLQHLSTKNSLRKLEKEMEALTQQKIKAEEQSKASTAKISELEEALQSSQLNAVNHGDLVARHQELIASSNGKIQELQEKCEQQVQDMDSLRQEMSVLQVQIKEADAQHTCTLKKRHELERKLEDMSQERAREKSDLQEKIETMTAKINDVEAELQGAKRKACSYDDLISEHVKLKSSLSEATVVSSNLQKVDSLQSQLLASGQEVSNRDLEINELRSELRHALEAKDAVSAEHVALATQLQALEETMSSRGGKFQKEVADLKGSLIELQLKLTSLQGRKDALESDNDELKVKLRNAHILQGQLEEEQKVCSSLRAKFVELEEGNTRLEEQLRAKEAELNQKCSEMSQKVELGRHSLGELIRECDQLRSDLQTKSTSFHTEKAGLEKTVSSLLRDKQLLEEKINSLNLNGDRNAELMAQLRAKMEQKVAGLSKEIKELRTAMKSKESNFLTERERMNATISCLLEDKRNLEEKQCTLHETVTKMEAERALNISGGSSQFESTASAASLTPTKVQPTSKLDRHVATSGIKKSTNLDSAMRRERRIAAHDVRRNLESIWDTSRDCGTMTDPEDSQAIALNMEHPLKAENEQLKSRLLEEQHKGELLKQKIRDLTSRIGYHFDS